MKPDKNKDITEHIAEMLRKHSLPYKEGAWERFKEFEASKKKKVIWWPYLSGVAAAILIAFTVLMNMGDGNINPKDTEAIALSEVSSPSELNKQEERSQNPVVAEVPQHKAASSPIESTTKTKNTAKTENPTVERINERKLLASNDLSSNKDVPSRQVDEVNQVAIASINEETSVSSTQSYAAKVPNPNEGAQPFGYQEEHDSANKFANQSSDKWDFSFEVSPNIKDNNVNFGGGVGVAYNISKRLSISSGVSYVQLDAHRGPNQVDIPQEFSKTSLNSYSYTKSLNEINTSLTGLDIPVNLKLNINSNMYASAGVSVFSVLNESRNNSFEEHVPVLAFSADASSQKAPQPVINTVYSTEESTVTPYEGKNFTGFFNLSVGYKLPFLQRLNLAIEPYVKLPIGSLSRQDMDLSNGGLKIITSF